MNEHKYITNSEGPARGGEQLSLDLVRKNVAKLTGGRAVSINDVLAAGLEVRVHLHIYEDNTLEQLASAK